MFPASDPAITPIPEENIGEALCNHFSGIAPTQLSALGVTPILAVVVHGDPPLLCGILMPHAGITIEHAPHSQIPVQHLPSLVNKVGYLFEAGVIHGDIYTRNVCLDGASTQLIDFGEIAPGYRTDPRPLCNSFIRADKWVKCGKSCLPPPPGSGKF